MFELENKILKISDPHFFWMFNRQNNIKKYFKNFKIKNKMKKEKNITTKQKIKKTLFKTILWIKENIPILLWVILIISMLKYSNLFQFLHNLKENFFSVILTGIIGSIAVWNPINSYIISWEIWTNKILLISIFMITRITVGFIQIPAEIYFFGKKFAIRRNIISFVLAIVWTYLIYFLINL